MQSVVFGQALKISPHVSGCFTGVFLCGSETSSMSKLESETKIKKLSFGFENFTSKCCTPHCWTVIFWLWRRQKSVINVFSKRFRNIITKKIFFAVSLKVKVGPTKLTRSLVHYQSRSYFYHKKNFQQGGYFVELRQYRGWMSRAASLTVIMMLFSVFFLSTRLLENWQGTYWLMISVPKNKKNLVINNLSKEKNFNEHW